MRDLVVIDTETSGLDPNVHEVIELAAVRLHPTTLEVKAEHCEKVVPQNIEKAEPKALQVNGYTPEKWADATPRRDALINFSRVCQNGVWVGHNAQFDRRFVMAAFWREKMPMPAMDYRQVCTVSMGWPLVATGKLTSVSLENLCNYFGIDNTGAHSALVDVYRTIEVYRRLMEIWSRAAA